MSLDAAQQHSIQRLAEEVKQYLSSAICDLASDWVQFPPNVIVRDWIRKSQEQGVDKTSYIADQIFDNTEIEIIEALIGIKEDYNAVLDELDKTAHKAMKKAILELRKE